MSLPGRVIGSVSGAVLAVLIVPTVIGFASDPTTVNSAKGYSQEAAKALSNVGGQIGDSQDGQSNSSASGESSSSDQGAAASSSQDANQPVSAIQERQLTKSYVVIGSGADQSQLDTLKSTLNVSDDTTALTSNAQDVKQYTDIDVEDSSVISSVSVIPASKGSGVNVTIADFQGKNNITQITQEQYAMVATMAGLKDVTITVTADKPISGHGALAGLYKALAADGITVSNENTQVANGMLDSTNQAIADNPDDDEYASKLAGAVLDASGKVANGEDPAKALKESLDTAGIADKTSESAQKSIADQLTKFQSTPVAGVKDYSDNIKDTTQSLISGGYADDVDNTISKLTGKNQNILQKTGTSFVNGWHVVVGWGQSAWTWVSTMGKGAKTEITNKVDEQSSSEQSSSGSSKQLDNGQAPDSNDQSVSIVSGSSAE